MSMVIVVQAEAILLGSVLGTEGRMGGGGREMINVIVGEADVDGGGARLPRQALQIVGRVLNGGVRELKVQRAGETRQKGSISASGSDVAV